MKDHDWINEHDWRDKMLVEIVEIRKDQSSMLFNFSRYAESNNARVDKLNYLVIGNGTPGLAEKMRNVVSDIEREQRKWAVIVVIGGFFAQLVGTYTVRHLPTPTAVVRALEGAK